MNVLFIEAGSTLGSFEHQARLLKLQGFTDEEIDMVVMESKAFVHQAIRYENPKPGLLKEVHHHVTVVSQLPPLHDSVDEIYEDRIQQEAVWHAKIEAIMQGQQGVSLAG